MRHYKSTVVVRWTIHQVRIFDVVRNQIIPLLIEHGDFTLLIRVERIIAAHFNLIVDCVVLTFRNIIQFILSAVIESSLCAIWFCT